MQKKELNGRLSATAEASMPTPQSFRLDTIHNKDELASSLTKSSVTNETLVTNLSTSGSTIISGPSLLKNEECVNTEEKSALSEVVEARPDLKDTYPKSEDNNVKVSTVNDEKWDQESAKKKMDKESVSEFILTDIDALRPLELGPQKESVFVPKEEVITKDHEEVMPPQNEENDNIEGVDSPKDRMQIDVFDYDLANLPPVTRDSIPPRKKSQKRMMKELRYKRDRDILSYREIMRTLPMQREKAFALLPKRKKSAIWSMRNRDYYYKLRRVRDSPIDYSSPIDESHDNSELSSSSEESRDTITENYLNDSREKERERSLGNRITPKFWTSEENKQLLAAVQKYGNQWGRVAKFVSDRSSRQCKEHWTRVLSKREGARGIDAQAIAKSSKAKEAEVLLKQWKDYQTEFNFQKNNQSEVSNEKKQEPEELYNDTVADPNPQPSFEELDDSAPEFEPHQKSLKNTRRHTKGGDAREIRIGYWLPEEDRALVAAHARLGSRWIQVANIIPGRTKRQCERRFRRLKEKLKKQVVES